jgi:EAL domain-containing protein (putative c-di-GMP-specific phosphodiesterase class I)
MQDWATPEKMGRNHVKILQAPRCSACKDGIASPFAFSMAFQPIVDVQNQSIFAYEALVRGINGEGAFSILSQITDENRYSFDQNCRVRAITLASQLGLDRTPAKLSINFMPGAVYSPAACIQLTLKTADALSFPAEKLIFEITEAEQVRDRKHIRSIVEEYRKHGFSVAIDDFGAGYSGLNLLADFPPDILKLDMDLARNIDRRPTAQHVVSHMVSLARTIGCQLIAEGIETVEEFEAMRDCGVTLMQGYLFAKPAFEGLPAVTFPQPYLHSSQHLHCSETPFVAA